MGEFDTRSCEPSEIDRHARQRKNPFVIAQRTSNASPSSSCNNLMELSDRDVSQDVSSQTHSIDLKFSSPLGNGDREKHVYSTVIPFDTLEDYASVDASFLSSPLSQCHDIERKLTSTSRATSANKRNSDGRQREYRKCPTCHKEILGKSYAAHVAIHNPVKYNKSCLHCDFVSHRSDYVKRHIAREHLNIEKGVSPRRIRACQTETSVTINNSDGDSVASSASILSIKRIPKKKSMPSFLKIKLPSMTKKSYYSWKTFRSLGVFKCDLCPTEFLSRKSLCRHRMLEHKRKQLHCKLCNFVTRRSGRMEEHVQSMHQSLAQQVYDYYGQSKSSLSTLRMSEEPVFSRHLNQSKQIDFVDGSKTKCDLRISPELTHSVAVPHSKNMRKSMQQVGLNEGEQRANSAFRRAKENGQFLGAGHSKHIYTSTQTVRECSTDWRMYTGNAQFLNVTGPKISKEWLCCQHCDYRSHRYDFFSIHVERAHNEEGMPEVKRRYKAFLGEKVSRSINTDPSASQFECETCHKILPSSNGLACHVIRHNPRNWKCCPHCDFKSFEASRIKTHIRNLHSKSNSVATGITSQSFSMKSLESKSVKKITMTVSTREGYVKCNICQKDVRLKRWTEHRKIHDPTSIVFCSYCPYSSYSAYNLKYHMLNLHSDRSSPPVMKPNKPSNKLSLKQCSTQSASTEVSLAASMKKPSEIIEKTAKCRIRQKDLNNLNLDAHIRSHDTIEWIRCKLCAYVCRRKVLLELHLHQFHNSTDSRSLVNEPIKKGCKECPICKGILNNKYLRLHLLAHDPTKWMHCPHCEYVTAIPSTLKKHVARHVKRHAEQKTKHATKDTGKSTSLSSCEANTSTSACRNAEQPVSPSLHQEDSSLFEESDEDRFIIVTKSSVSVLKQTSLRDAESSSGSTATSLNFTAIGKHLSAVLQSRFGNVAQN